MEYTKTSKELITAINRVSSELSSIRDEIHALPQRLPLYMPDFVDKDEFKILISRLEHINNTLEQGFVIAEGYPSGLEAIVMQMRGELKLK